MCVCQRALSLLCAGRVGCAGAALEAVGGVSGEQWEALGLGPAAGHQFAFGLAALRQGDAGEAKALLSRCLKMAHAQPNNELVTQALALLVPITVAEGDVVQANAMLRSGYALSKSCGDVAGELASISGWALVHRASGKVQDAAEMDGQAQRKRAKLESAIQAARQCGGAHDAAVALP